MKTRGVAGVRRVDFVRRRSVTWRLDGAIDSRLLLDPIFREHFAPYLRLPPSDGEYVAAVAELRRRNINLASDAATIARRVHQTVINTLEVPSSPEGDGAGVDDMVAAMNGESAAPELYAELAVMLGRLSGVPTRRVYGFLIDDAGAAVEHRWVEFFLPSVGWIPGDPLLGDGAYSWRITGLDRYYGDDLQGGTFGSLDNRRIALHIEGALPDRIHPGGARVEPENSYAPGALHIEFPTTDVPDGVSVHWDFPIVSVQFN